MTGGHAAPKQERVRKDTHAVVVGDDVVVIKFLENVDFCDNLLSVALGHALKIEFLAGEDDPVSLAFTSPDGMALNSLRPLTLAQLSLFFGQ